MGLRAAEDTGSRFVAFVEGLVSVIGHADRAGPLLSVDAIKRTGQRLHFRKWADFWREAVAPLGMR
jgi:hypothetical protein